MQTYSEFSPTPFDHKGAFLDDDRQEWVVAPVGQTRDSGPLDHANFAAVEADLDSIDPDGSDHETHRFGHWGPGWFEIIIARPDTKCTDSLESFENALDDYPVLDDEAFSQLEHEDEIETWNNCLSSDFARAIEAKFELEDLEESYPSLDTDELFWNTVLPAMNEGFVHSSEGAWLDVEEAASFVTIEDLRASVKLSDLGLNALPQAKGEA